jgi:hypothetical protein
LIDPFHAQNGASTKEKSANELILAHLLPFKEGGEPTSAHLHLSPITLSFSESEGLHLFVLMRGTHCISFRLVGGHSQKEKQGKIENSRKIPFLERVDRKRNLAQKKKFVEFSATSASTITCNGLK